MSCLFVFSNVRFCLKLYIHILRSSVAKLVLESLSRNRLLLNSARIPSGNLDSFMWGCFEARLRNGIFKPHGSNKYPDDVFELYLFGCWFPDPSLYFFPLLNVMVCLFIYLFILFLCVFFERCSPLLILSSLFEAIVNMLVSTLLQNILIL